MGEIIPLNADLAKECLQCVEILEDLLEQAKQGRIRTLTIGYARPNGTVGTRWSQGDVIPVFAAAALLFNRVMDDRNEA